jgi:hypothetical protein
LQVCTGAVFLPAAISVMARSNALALDLVCVLLLYSISLFPSLPSLPSPPSSSLPACWAWQRTPMFLSRESVVVYSKIVL